ncbi:hypothetical protein OUHCRE5_01210 [Enterobacter asburiae]
MSTLLRSAALVLCAGVSCAQASETAKQWEFNIGAMYEIENVEGQGDDKDGLYEPSVWFNATWDAWTISLAMYQEGPVDYSSMTRGTYFDRPEFELRYRFIGTDDFTFGLTGGFRNYGYHFKDEHGAKDGSANMQRYKVQPDWDIKLTDDWRFGGWFAMYQFANDLEKTGYSDSRVETETGFTWTINETFAARVNYYLERGFNMNGSRNNGEFSTQEIRKKSRKRLMPLQRSSVRLMRRKPRKKPMKKRPKPMRLRKKRSVKPMLRKKSATTPQ